MADTLLTLQARRDALQKALDSGALSIRQGDTSITYRSQKELLEALAAIDARIANFGAGTRVKTIRVRAKSDWGV